MPLHRHVAVVLTILLLPSLQHAAERPALQDLGRSVKMRILVDKVMQPTRGWTTEEWMVKEAAAAGFNVFSPRSGYDRPEAVRQVTEWCRKAGIYHQPWMRGVQDVPKDMSQSDGRRIVWANGAEQPIWSPNSDELWQWMASYIVPYAQMGADDHTLMGVFLDYENYWRGGMGNLYDLSYDDVIMGKFAAHKGIALPQLALDKRKAWLDEQKLHDEFRDFQIAYWRLKCRELRQAVDKVNPEFQFNIYPAPGTLFMLEACYPEWATAKAPLLLADPWTYGRSGKYAKHEAALKTNQLVIERGKAVAEAKGINYIYLGGIDPVVGGADPEFCGKNALLLTGLTGGYWIFYEGPKYETTHPDYFKWFTWANRKIEAGDYAAAWQPRETEDPGGFPKIKVSGRPLPRTEKRDVPLATLRGTNALLVAGHKGVPLHVTLQTVRIGKNEGPVVWTIKDTNWADLAQGEVAVAGTGAITYTPAADGILVLLLESGGNACAVKDSDTALAIYTDPAPHFIYGAAKLYFSVPAGLAQFTVTVKGSGGAETVKATICDPTGAVAAEGETNADSDTAKLTVKVGEHGGKVWSLTTGKASTGVLEDNTIALDKALPQVLSYFADEVFELDARR